MYFIMPYNVLQLYAPWICTLLRIDAVICSLKFNTMEAIEFLNIVQPEHDRTSCSDDNIQNGFWSLYGYNNDNKWQGRCRRCIGLQIINNDEDVPKGVDLSDCL